jgi:glycerol-3-phosphate dehydrogenase
MIRSQNWDHAKRTLFDAVLIGGGINGACLYHHLCRQGLKVLLVDKGDFACGSSQSSGMMIWGGLLYLRNLDLFSVNRFSRARDKMIKDHSQWVSPRLFRYLPAMRNGRNKYLVLSGLYLYWLFGRFQRKLPVTQDAFHEEGLIKNNSIKGSLLYEEGCLKDSDSRFVLHWITSHHSATHIPINYCSVEGGSFSSKEKIWHLNLKDTLSGEEITAQTRMVINCAGVWTDSINQQFGIESPCKHVFSKGVYLGLKRPANHHLPMILEMGQHGDVLTYVPWGPVSMWGPTETTVKNIEQGYTANKDDVSFLLDRANACLETGVNPADIISLRCGIRPLVVGASFNKDCYPLNISRRHKIIKDPHKQWISVYGGKITSCVPLAQKVTAMVCDLKVGDCNPPQPLDKIADVMASTTYPTVPGKIPGVEWSMRHEYCLTLEDYLRRRTNIAQWVPRQGLGNNNEYLGQIKKIALKLHQHNEARAATAVQHYQQSVNTRFDAVINELR